MSFITDLQKKRCNYNHPDQATSQANSLILLSYGIYTEEERFVFELLQNAVDAHIETNGALEVKMIIENGYFVFLHNGEPFSERDIEGLCDVGNGNKMNDVKKIGYKGIGFKSVFMRSSNVTILSGKYCFKFDKQYWDNYWNEKWDDKAYGIKDNDREYLMPWQIIPIETSRPIDGIDLNDFNVATYIQITDTKFLETKILKLLSSSQFLLFLRSRNINMTFVVNGEIKCWVSKNENDNQVSLSKNGIEESRWLIYTNENVEVPLHLKDKISTDINTPNKLKGANTFDLSFAIALDGKKLKRLEPEDAVVYTYLPTSFKFGTIGFPFLVNANFITDAGRQQLHKDSEWNKLIFSKIPHEFLSWIKELSSTYKNYWEILPEISYGKGNPLEMIYEDEMKKAIAAIAFIPQSSNSRQKVLASNAVMDKMNVSDVITKESLINHINRTYSKNFSVKGLVDTLWKGSRILGEYGVFIFDKNKLKRIFDDEKTFDNINTDLNKELIDYLYKYYYENKQEQGELISILRNTKFLLDENSELQCPTNLFFPSPYKKQNELAKEDAKILHPDVYFGIEENKQIIDWLEELGVETLSDITFIKNVICQKDYITKDNAVEAIRFLYSANQKKNIFEEIDDSYLSKLMFISKQNNLKTSENLYLGSFYKPTTNIEEVFDGDIYISEIYPKRGDNIDEWSLFFKKMGIKDTLEITPIRLNSTNEDSFLKNLKDLFNKEYNIGSWGTKFHYSFSYFKIYYAPFVLTTNCSHEFLKLIWSTVLTNEYQYNSDSDTVEGYAGYWNASRTFSYFSKPCYLRWAFENVQKFPSTDGRLLRPNELFQNTEDIKCLAGNYLPVIDIDGEIHKSWLRLLNLQNTITIYDCLEILTNVSKDKNKIESNKERIAKVYQRLVELDALSTNNQAVIKNWASQNLILSKDNIFVPPSELSHITLDGFSPKNRVYIGSPSEKEKVIELLALMGVKIITEHSIRPNFNGRRESEILKKILKGRLAPLALVSSGEETTSIEYKVQKKKIGDLLNETHFYHCDEINLTYGNTDDTIKKHTFGKGNEFYYIGDLRPANIDPLLTPLCQYLNLKGKERELFIMMVEDSDGIKQYLKDKGYDIALLDEGSIESGNIQVTITQPTEDSIHEKNIITGLKGEIIVYEKLKSMGYNPICYSLSTKDDYDRKVTLNGKVYYCKISYEKYDIKFETHRGNTKYVEVKATTYNKEYQENMPISYNELSMIEKYNDISETAYIIVRVFGIDQPQQEIYMLNCHLGIDESELWEK